MKSLHRTPRTPPGALQEMLLLHPGEVQARRCGRSQVGAVIDKQLLQSDKVF